MLSLYIKALLESAIIYVCVQHADHRNAEQRAADAKHAKEVRKAEAALKAKQHEYEKEQQRLAQEQGAVDGEAIAKRLQQAHLAATPTTAGTLMLFQWDLLPGRGNFSTYFHEPGL